MKIVILTGNGIRHKFLANALSQKADDALVVTECKESYADSRDEDVSHIIKEHFDLRAKTEADFFKNNDYFLIKTIPLPYKDTNSPRIYDIIKRFNPDIMFVFGSCIIKEPLLSLMPAGRFINLHLGLSPYYRGSGTNFWPFINKELEYIGSTILHIDAGIDTGDIIAHVQPKIAMGDNVHTVGCKVIKESVEALIKLMEKIKSGETLNRTKQWQVENVRYYKKKDFNEEVLRQYYENLAGGLVENYLRSRPNDLKLIGLLPKRIRCEKSEFCAKIAE